MKRGRFMPATAFVAILSLLCFTSCVDESYDIEEENLDLTINVGGELAIPSSYSEVFTLKDVMDLEDNSTLQAVKANNPYGLQEGDYAIIEKSSETTETEIDIDDVKLTEYSGSEAGHIELYVPNPLFDFREEIKQIQNAGLINIEEYIKQYRQDIIIEIKDGESEFFEIKDWLKLHVEEDNITDDIREIHAATVEGIINAELYFSENNSLNNIYIKEGFELVFPDFLVLSPLESQSDLYTIVDGHIVKFIRDFRITNKQNDGLGDITFHITDFIVDGEQAKFEDQKFTLDATINLTGEIMIPGECFTLDLIEEKNIHVDLYSGVSLGQGGIELIDVTGIVDPEIELDIDPIEITGLPDFLKENVTIDMDNPCITLYVGNSTPASVTFGATFIAKSDKGDKTVKIENIEIKGSEDPSTPKENIIKLVRKATGAPGEQVVENINDLIVNVPDEIEIKDIKAHVVQEPITVQLGETYRVTTDYEVVAPLAFGPELSINYKETIDGMNEDLDLEDVDFETTVITSIGFVNGLPLNLEVVAEAIDVDKNKIDEVLVDIRYKDENGQPVNHILAGQQGQPTSTYIEISLAFTTNIEKFDGLNLTLRADSKDAEGVNLNENMTLQLKDVVVRLKDGITIDMN